MLLQEVISFAIEAELLVGRRSPLQEAQLIATVILNYNTIHHVKVFRAVGCL
jgi:hypothetical protein